ncbi:Ger(x)C family spore germination protein [Peribacillus simplex]|uniref:Ger(x)C family spore germination protein n=1 Tax=Peribacillus simplex TaxID=1478 RepID=UPI0024C11242|nr:Ger(x)C family spore germination protein [Peribacillus simplex]MDR4929645.1 Ger(x)C family spore germination protein [Peribacillus simplex]WHX90624.1 Ger(x)C family spore germination protein [Peribacillus simplex]
MNTISLTKAVKLMFTFSICSSTLLLAGCWDRVEINNLGIVLAAGLDKTADDKFEISVQMAIPEAMGGGQGMGGGEGGGGKMVIVEKATGTTIFDAMTLLQEKFSRRIFWGHNQVIIIGEKLAKEGIQKHIDFFARYPDSPIRANTFVTDGEAIDVLKAIPDLERSSAEFARDLANLKVGMSVTVKDLLQMLSGESEATALPWIEVEQEGRLSVNGTAVFKKDKMVGRIDDKITRGLLWVRNEIELSAVTVKPKKGAEDHISFNLLRSRTELIPKIENGNWIMTVKIVTEDDVVENETKLNLMNPRIVKKLERQLEQEIEQRIRIMLEQLQKEMEADILGFAEAFHLQYPDQWSKVKDQWGEKFPEIEVEIKSKAYIRRPGMSTSPQGVPEKEVIGN